MTSRAISCAALIGIFVPAGSFTFRAPVPHVRRLFADQGEAGSNSPPTEDWRDFRARLVAQESGGTKSSANGDQAWAYETSLVERGSVLMGGTEAPQGFELHQQYFHKCVIIVLSHTSTFTRGLIINRPTPQELTTPESAEPWRLWFGGDVQGLWSKRDQDREIFCLHALPSSGNNGSTGSSSSSESGEGATGGAGVSLVDRLSSPLVGACKWTSFEGARELVRQGLARPRDFWVFVGYCGWGPGQLQRELDRKAWHSAATSADQILARYRTRLDDEEKAAVEAAMRAKDSSAMSPQNSPTAASSGANAAVTATTAAAAAVSDDDVSFNDDVGMGTWAQLMGSIGRSTDAAAARGGLADDMLREWARVHLAAAATADEEEEEASVTAPAATNKAAVAKEVTKSQIDSSSSPNTRGEANANEEEQLVTAATGASEVTSEDLSGIPESEQLKGEDDAQRELRRLIRKGRATGPAEVARLIATPGSLKGRLLRTTLRGARGTESAAPRYILDRQYLHKSLVLVLADEPTMTLGVVLNRVSASSVGFRSTISNQSGQGKADSGKQGQQMCRLGLGGEANLGNGNVLIFHRGQVPALLAAAANPSDCKLVEGGSGLWVISPSAAGNALAQKLAQPSDLLCLAGVTAWSAGNLREELGVGALEPVDPRQVPWEDLFNLHATKLTSSTKASDVLAASVEVWRQSGNPNSSPASSDSGKSSAAQGELEEDTVRTRLADAALARYNDLFLLPKGMKFPPK